jgi:poly-gamma-glutamate synthase PgsB/CapB
VASCLEDDALPAIVQDAALRLLVRALAQGRPYDLLSLARTRLLPLLETAARAPGTTPWFLEAFHLALAQLDAPAFALRMLSHFGSPRSGVDEAFLRARLVKCVAAWEFALTPEDVDRILDLASSDVSEIVRLECVAVDAQRLRFGSLQRVVAEDPCPRVRVRVISCLAANSRAPSASRAIVDAFFSACAVALAADSPAPCRLAAMDALAMSARNALRDGGPTTFPTALLLATATSSTPFSALSVRLDALPDAPDFRGPLARSWHVFVLARWALANDAIRDAAPALARFATGLPSGTSRRVPRELTDAFPTSDDLARVLALLAVDDFGFELSPLAGKRWLLSRGHVFGLRAWRILHELRSPSSDKRQGFRHTVGRVFGGGVHVPSQILCELAQTRVPGEPLYLSDDDGWRPSVPLPDEFVSCVFGGRPLKVFTPQGVTLVEPPVGVLTRARAWWSLTARFARFAALRNWTEGQQAPANAYVAQARALGFEVRFEPAFPGAPSTRAAIPMVKFFRRDGGLVGSTVGEGVRAASLSLTDPGTVLAGAASIHAGWVAFQRFVADANANTLGELLVFLCAILLLFVGSHLWRHVQFRRARGNLPLVVGGWGTRGKSGTERLKAALFSAMGFSVVSKTTGCEATLLLAAPFAPLREVPLYRPYDKATVWEQHAVVEFASAFGGNVFLWECMGLTPDYVRILQRSWMRDDVSTLTNAYPDHEDLQGPAGVNIPEVMTNFVPRNGLLCTTEEQMLPILREAARDQGSEVRAAGWREAALLPPDIMELFPYEEHPYNVSLVLEVARAMGIEPLFALKSMAENVVPDIGVLKTYPAVEGRAGRSLVFSNGCSANERHGAKGNWIRLGFDVCSPDDFPGTRVSAFVNNRADRTARSHVFARVMVFDTPVDRHVLVGSNVSGLVGFYEEAVGEYVGGVALWQPSEEGAASADDIRGLAIERLQRHFRHLRLATSGGLVRQELLVMLRGVGLSEPHADTVGRGWMSPEGVSRALEEAGVSEAEGAAVVAHLLARLTEWQTYQRFLQRIAEVESPLTAGGPSGEGARVDADLRAYVRERFLAKLLPLDEDLQTDGDALVDALVAGVPPGFQERLMGVQNIKGPGLVLLYRLEIAQDLGRLLELLEGSGARYQKRQILARLESATDLPRFARVCLARSVDRLLDSGNLEAEEARVLGDFRRRTGCAQEVIPEGSVRSHVEAFQASLVSKEGPSKVSTRPADSFGMAAVARGLGELVEPLKAVVRRKRADRVYRALAGGCLSPEQAAGELRRLIDGA